MTKKAKKKILSRSRRVFVQLEVETARPLAELRRPTCWNLPGWSVRQVQVNVARR